jgi:hypothetical protein
MVGAMRWTVLLIVTTPIAKSLSVSFAEEPEDREVYALMESEGAVTATVTPPKGSQ